MTRKDFLDDPKAPQASNIVVACSAFVQNPFGHILMIRRTDNNFYSIPGGRLNPGETLTECAIRETQEETNVTISIIGIVGIFSNPRHVIEYSDGEVRQEFSICFRARPTGGESATSDESSEVLWQPVDALDELSIHPSTRLRIDRALSDDSVYFT